MGSVHTLVGAQWGSEGKGVVAAALAHHFRGSIRTGGPNAGHSFYYDGQKYVARSVPVSWINPECVVIIGSGGVVNPEQLAEEMSGLPDRVRVYLDERATLIKPSHEHEEAEIRQLIGSTQEGVGQARIAKIKRDGSAVLADEWAFADPRIEIVHTQDLIRGMIFREEPILLEGTQGAGLSLHHGTRYPYCTSNDTNAAALFADAGIAPRHAGCSFIVARTYPIRVAGTSGPMGKEIDWETLGVPAEFTTVTKKTRRVAEFFDDVFDDAVHLNAPCGVFLTFADYIDPEIAGTNDRDTILSSPAIGSFIGRLERTWGVPVVGVSTGGPEWSIATVNYCKHDIWWDTRHTADVKEGVPA